MQSLTSVLAVPPLVSLPAGHTLHAVAPVVEPEALYVLAGQATQLSPVPRLKKPAAHGWHAAALPALPAPRVSVPAGHSVQPLLPLRLYVLGEHTWHDDAEVGLKVPAAHGAHASATPALE
jgi:hypothetical protein